MLQPRFVGRQTRGWGALLEELGRVSRAASRGRLLFVSYQSHKAQVIKSPPYPSCYGKSSLVGIKGRNSLPCGSRLDPRLTSGGERETWPLLVPDLGSQG